MGSNYFSRGSIQSQYTCTTTGGPSSANEERSGSVLESLTRDRGVAGSSLTGGTALCH